MERKSQIIKVLGGSNWQYKICDTVKPDLGIRNLNTTKDDNKPCYRTYQGGSVVHLLRAIRLDIYVFIYSSVVIQISTKVNELIYLVLKHQYKIRRT